MTIFTPEQRERLREELVSAAENDPGLCGAAHTGSAASSQLDRWSDIDLALSVKPEASHEEVVAAWTERLYRRHAAVAHVDVMRGPTLFRVFLLENTLQVDVAFWRAQDFAALGPKFQLIFGEAQPPQAAPGPERGSLIGMAWLYGLHVRSSLARGRVLQAEYMLSGMRNQIGELLCQRCGETPQQGRGLDDLPSPERIAAVESMPRSLEQAELKRAFAASVRALVGEIENGDGEAGAGLIGALTGLLV